MRRTIALTALLVCCCGTSAAGDIEITAMYGYRWGGEIDADQSPLFTEDVEIDDGAAYGLAVGFRPHGALIIELSANVQQSRFTDSDSLFGDSTELFDVDTAFYQVGVGGCWTLADGEFEMFLTGALGVASLNPDAPGARTATEFSTSIGGGMKVWAVRNFGSRFELRSFWANTGDDDSCWGCFWDKFDNDLFQTEARVGLIVRF